MPARLAGGQFLPPACYTAAVSEPTAPADPDDVPAAEPAAPAAGRPGRTGWRKRAAPVLLLLSLGVLAHETCKSKERRAVTLQLDLGASARRVRRLWVDVFVDGEPVAQYKREGGEGMPSLEARLVGEAAEVRIDLELAPLTEGGEVTRRVVTRRVHGEGGSTVTVPLGDELSK